jgi:hypothetical protein
VAGRRGKRDQLRSGHGAVPRTSSQSVRPTSMRLVLDQDPSLVAGIFGMARSSRNGPSVHTRVSVIKPVGARRQPSTAIVFAGGRRRQRAPSLRPPLPHAACRATPSPRNRLSSDHPGVTRRRTRRHPRRTLPRDSRQEDERLQNDEALPFGTSAQCAEENSNLHPVIPDQALNPVTRVSYPSGSRQIGTRRSRVVHQCDLRARVDRPQYVRHAGVMRRRPLARNLQGHR